MKDVVEVNLTGHCDTLRGLLGSQRSAHWFGPQLQSLMPEGGEELLLDLFGPQADVSRAT